MQQTNIEIFLTVLTYVLPSSCQASQPTLKECATHLTYSISTYSQYFIKMNCIILSALFASALIGVSTANPVMQQACALAPLVQQLYGATDQACGTTCLQDPNSQDGCPANACTVAIGVMAAEAAAAQFGHL